MLRTVTLGHRRVKEKSEKLVLDIKKPIPYPSGMTQTSTYTNPAMPVISFGLDTTNETVAAVVAVLKGWTVQVNVTAVYSDDPYTGEITGADEDGIWLRFLDDQPSGRIPSEYVTGIVIL